MLIFRFLQIAKEALLIMTITFVCCPVVRLLIYLYKFTAAPRK